MRSYRDWKSPTPDSEGRGKEGSVDQNVSGTLQRICHHAKNICKTVQFSSKLYFFSYISSNHGACGGPLFDLCSFAPPHEKPYLIFMSD
jgi:hypothetical protein